jgi:SRSO17 transposase
MERRFRVRLDELLTEAEVPPDLLRDLGPRLEAFLQPFVATLPRQETRSNALHYAQGLLSNLGGKNAEAIAYLHDQDRQALQKFIGQAPWDYRPLLDELARQVGQELGEPDGVLVFDPSAFPKKGSESVGVQRQWCGRLGKVENCQVGVYLAYVARRDHALVDVRLYLPKEWASQRQRRKKVGVPREVRFRTRHELALEMLDQRSSLLPHTWVAGDDEFGRCGWFREQLRGRHERYLLAVPANTLVRDLAAAPPPYGGRGRQPQVPFTRVERWCAALSEDAWQSVEVGAGAQGPLVVQMTKALVQARTEGRPCDVAEWLVVFRTRQSDGTWKHDYLLSNGMLTTSDAEFARVYTAQHRVEECLRRAKHEAGLAGYQVRTWEGWHHHQTLSLLATWFLTQETRRGKKAGAGVDAAAGAGGLGQDLGSATKRHLPGSHRPHPAPSLEAQRGSTFLSLETAQPLATSAL